jgi:hypothetical protein
MSFSQLCDFNIISFLQRQSFFFTSPLYILDLCKPMYMDVCMYVCTYMYINMVFPPKFHMVTAKLALLNFTFWCKIIRS